MAPNVQLFGAGLNIFTQLDNNGIQGGDATGEDRRSFNQVADVISEGQEITRLFFASWSSTVLLCNNRLVCLGSQACDIALEDSQNWNELHSPFGNHAGLIGCLSKSGALHLLDSQERPTRLVCQTEPEDASPLIGHIALADNDRVAITFKQAPNGKLCHILDFDDLAAFLGWYLDPSGVTIDEEKQHFMIPGRPIQLLANTTTFMCLMEGGEVWTWGDPRLRTLGRLTVGEDATPAERPGQVMALGGLNIVKVASGGWYNAALSEDGACYLWGRGMPGHDSNTIDCLEEADAGELVLVELPSPGADESLDVLDIGVAVGHVAILAEGGRLFVAGEHRNGQLGLNSSETFVGDWQEVTCSSFNQIQSVSCAPRVTLVTATVTGL